MDSWLLGKILIRALGRVFIVLVARDERGELLHTVCVTLHRLPNIAFDALVIIFFRVILKVLLLLLLRLIL